VLIKFFFFRKFTLSSYNLYTSITQFKLKIFNWLIWYISRQIHSLRKKFITLLKNIHNQSLPISIKF